MKTRTKLVLGFAVIVALLWMIVTYAWGNLGYLNRQFSTVEEEIIPDTIAMTEVEKLSSEIYRDVTEYIYRDDLYYDTEESKDAALQKLSRLEEIGREYLPATATAGSVEHGKDSVLANRISDFCFSTVSIINLKKEGADYSTLVARDRMTCLPALLAVQERAGDLKAASIRDLTTVKTAFDNAYSNGVQSLYSSAILITLLALAAALFTTRSIVRPLLALRKGTEIIAEGKLDYKVGTEAKDEIGELSRAFDQMTQSLSTSVTSIDNLNQEIAERKKAEEALRESEEKFSVAFRSSPDMVVLVNLQDGKYVEVNDSFANFSGYTREELIGHTDDEFNMWVNTEKGDRMTRLMDRQGKIRQKEYLFRTKSGEIRWWLCSADTINIGGTPHMLAVATDITERKKMEEALRESEERFSKAFHASPGSMSISRLRDGAFIEVNDSFLKEEGYTREEVIGHNAKELDIWKDQNHLNEVMQMLHAQGRVHNVPTQFRTKSGETRTGYMSAEIISLGNEPCMIVLTTDITKQKEMEAKFQAQKQLVERILATMPEGVLVIDSDERVILTNEAFHKIFHAGEEAVSGKLLNKIIPVSQLFKLYKDVKRGNIEKNTLEFRYQVEDQEKIIICVINKMDGERTLLTFIDVSHEREEEEKLYLTDRLASIGEMAAGLAHELNNPLTGILALSQLLVDSDIPQEYKDDLQCVYSEARRAASIVRNVLLFARNTTYENGQTSTNEVVKDVLRLREYEEKVNNIRATTDLEENLPDIAMDKFQLQQVFLNIILNAEAAIKEANRPGILKVTTERFNSHVNIHIKDNGCGIKKHVLPRIFDPFFTTKEIGKGTGLGLSICYGIVVKHGGKISVKTNVNKGTTFTIKMPVVPQTVE